ncbi:HAMP domain-containing histidine kinase [Streptomyces sp. MUM 203J]|uniref:sensor histidine kinase n=1 Tax=Streptomyces sp. MUM 203J TaxID=2791990 RepID=UPI001F048A18|nr:HAMP domain-containing sensor histidine kinase [Streptomyces sp. MUM 203J]MCH0540410.1 HAMP domain-containing histidine kinase [Streptomyces sp. MUM 203J]
MSAGVVAVSAEAVVYAELAAGVPPPQDTPAVYTDRVGPVVGLLAWPGWLLGALAVTLVCWAAGHGLPRAPRRRAALTAGASSALLYLTYVGWLGDFNEAQPWRAAFSVYRWSLGFVGPASGLLTGLAVWAALRGGNSRLSFRGRLMLAASLAAGLLFLVALHLLWAAQNEWQAISDLYWVLLSTAVPVVGVLTGLLVQLGAARALRPVEAIRRELEDITGSSLDRRVPVPPTEDLIAHLARTTNGTLDRLEAASARQREFVADAAHELRSPLAALRTQLEGALRHPEGADWEGVVAGAAADVVRLQALADDLLLLARMDGTPYAEAGGVVDLSGIAEDLVREHRHLPTSEGLTLELDAPPVRVPGDAGSLERLLRNLLGNACRHATARVLVAVRVEDGTAVLEVLDDGPGIPADDRERVFARFTRLDEARARSSGGAGLGLAIAREIAVRHGGTLRAAASRWGGARLVARLPGGVSPGGDSPGGGQSWTG